MVELVFTACLLAGGGDCQKVTIPMEQTESISACMKAAPARIKEWQTDNQDKMVAGFSCKKV
ncbi:MAG: hypothetical protein ACPW61_10800 [Methyloligella sp. ZOD6]